MIFSVRTLLFLAFLAWIVPAAETPTAPAPKFVLQFELAVNDSTLTITDFKFPSLKRGIAAGFITRHGTVPILGDYEKNSPVALITSNGGDSWTQIPMKEYATSLFFLDDSVGWMTSPNGIWFTEESGRTWKRISPVNYLLRTWFVSRKHGFGAGTEKRVMETQDGGLTWLLVAAAALPETPAEWTNYSVISFNGNYGLISGLSRPPRRSDNEPAWLYPQEARLRSRNPEITIFLETTDIGGKWVTHSARIAGEITHIEISKERYGLALLEHTDAGPWPSELYRLSLDNGPAKQIYRDIHRAMTDLLLGANGDVILAGYQPVGQVRPSPLPGKMKVLRSSDLEHWEEIAVDYRAVAKRVILASPDGHDIWAATDTGMILKLQR